MELVCFPAKSTQILQPADAIFQVLKNKFAEIARRAQLAKPNGLVNKSNFSGMHVISGNNIYYE
jgi:hypothetical protein